MGRPVRLQRVCWATRTSDHHSARRLSDKFQGLGGLVLVMAIRRSQLAPANSKMIP